MPMSSPKITRMFGLLCVFALLTLLGTAFFLLVAELMANSPSSSTVFLVVEGEDVGSMRRTTHTAQESFEDLNKYVEGAAMLGASGWRADDITQVASGRVVAIPEK